MRISFTMQTGDTLLTLNDKQEQLAQLSQSISSGLKFSSPADDPSSWAQAMNVKQGLREYDSIVSNISFATGWEQQTDSALSQLSSLVSQAKQVAITATSATGTDQSSALATQVDSILQQVVNLANSQYGDQYIFAGTSTSSPPFSIDSTTGNVTYSGDSGSINVRTSNTDASAGNSTAVNLSGTDVFYYTSGKTNTNVMQEIWGLEQAIKNGDTSTISSKITTLDDAFNHVNDESSINGDRLSALTTQKSAISVFQTNDTSKLSTLEDTDVADATTKLTQAQTAFEAALKIAGQLGTLNLASILTGTTTTL